MATNTERITALEQLLKSSGMHQPTCAAITSAGAEACDCWIAVAP